jgi:hypothetical protein
LTIVKFTCNHVVGGEKMNCIYCTNEITKVSKEHIMQSALGCYKKSTKLLCPDCNNYFARAESGNIDTEFTEQFGLFRNLLNIWGDRNTPPPILYNMGTFEGHSYHVAPGGRPILGKSLRTQFTTDEGKKILTISSPNIDKAKEQLQHIKRQYGDEVQFNAVLRKSFLNQPFQGTLSFGGECALKAVLKNLYNFAFFLQRELNIDLGLSVDVLQDVRNYLRYNVGTNRCCSNLDFINDIPYTFMNDNISNYMFLFGSKAQHILFGYVVVFGQIIFSAILMNNYQGKDFAYGYEQTPNTGEAKLITPLSIPKYNHEAIVDFSTYTEVHMKGLEEHINNLLRVWSKMEQDNLIDSLTQNAVKEIHISEGELNTKESIGRLAQGMAEELVHYQYKIPSELPIGLEDEEGI